MAQDITIAGASFSGVPAIVVPKVGSGTARFDDASVTTATASDVASGKVFLASDGTVTTGTASGGGGGSGLTLLSTTSLGTLSTTSTNAADTGKTLTLSSSTNWDDYDVLVVDVRRTSIASSRHIATVSMILVTGTSSIDTKNTYTVVGNKWNEKRSSTNAASSRQSTSAYGIYANSASVSSSTMTIPLYYRYNSNSTGTLNGDYVAKVYGLKLYGGIGT